MLEYQGSHDIIIIFVTELFWELCGATKARKFFHLNLVKKFYGIIALTGINN